MLPGTPRRPSFTTTVDFGGSGAGGAAAGAAVAAAGVATTAGAGAGGGGGGEFALPPSCACASHPRSAGAAPNAKRAVKIKGAAVVRAIVVLLGVLVRSLRPAWVPWGERAREREPPPSPKPPLGRSSPSGSSTTV